MASKVFNPETRVDVGREYDFKGIDANRSFGTALKGVAGMIDDGAKGAVRSITQGIQLHAQEQEQSIQDNLFATEKVAAAQASTTAGGQAMPEDLTRGMKEALRLKEGYVKGHIRESDYLANIDVLAKKMRAKYGVKWQNEIDDAIGAAMSSTANRFRKQLFSEWDKDISDTNERGKAVRSLVQRYPEHYAAFPEMWQNPENYTEAEHLSVIGPREAAKWEITQQRNEASLTDENTERGKKKREESLSAATQHMMNSLVDVAGKPMLKQLDEKIKTFGEDEHFSKEEKKQLDAFLQTAQVELHGGVNKLLSDPLYIGLDESAKKAQFEAVDRQISLYRSMIHDEHSGVMSANLNKRKRAGEDVLQKWIDTNPNVGNIMSAYEAARAGGFADLVDETLREHMQSSGFDQGTVEKAISLMAQGMTTGGEDRLNEFSEYLFNNPDAADKEGAQMFLVGVDMMTRAITDDRTPIITKHRAARSLFSPSARPFLSHMDPASAEGMYYHIVSPQVIGTLKGMKETDAQSWYNFRTWAIDESFNVLFKSDVDTLVGENGGGVKYDATTFSFQQTSQRPSAQSGGSGRAGGMSIGQWDQTQARLDKLNKWVKRIRPIVEADGQEPTEELRRLFEERSFKTEKSAADSLVNRYLKALPKEETDGEGEGKEG
jgi:hypothetical protein